MLHPGGFVSLTDLGKLTILVPRSESGEPSSAPVASDPFPSLVISDPPPMTTDVLRLVVWAWSRWRIFTVRRLRWSWRFVLLPH